MRVSFLLQDTGVMYGAERATLDLVSGLRETGQVEVSATLIHESRLRPHGNGVQEAFAASGIPTVSLPTRHSFSWNLVKAIRRHLLEQNVDCLHVVGYKAAVHGALAVRFGRICPWVSTVHGWLQRPDLRETFYAWLEVWAIRRAQRVIALSDYYRTKLMDRGILAQRLALIPSGLRLDGLGVDHDNRPFAASTEVPTMGILGRLSWEKNHAMFLRVARRLLDEGCAARFLIAGDGPERPALLQMIRDLGLQSHVEMAGVIDRNDFFRRIDVLLVCSRIENLPYVILEAMAWSRPVVATRVGGIPEMIDPEHTGILVDNQDVDGMASAVIRLRGNPEFARTLAHVGRRRLETDFAPERNSNAHLRLYQSLLQP